MSAAEKRAGGRYHDEVVALQDKLGGTVILIVTGGTKGNGMAYRGAAAGLARTAKALREMASILESDEEFLALGRYAAHSPMIISGGADDSPIEAHDAGCNCRSCTRRRAARQP